MSGIAVASCFLKYRRDDVPLLDIKAPVELPEGFHLLVGPSGSGKTSLFRLLAGWYSADYHPDITHSVEIDIDRYRDVTLIGNHSSLLPWLRAIENIRLRAPSVADQRIHEIARELGLTDASLKAWPYELSLGMYKRVEFIAALLEGRRLLLLDEFLASLDEARRAVCLKLLNADRRNGQTTLISTHMPEALDVQGIPVLRFSKDTSGAIDGLAREP